MRELLYSGLLYLIGVAVLLAAKPALMFTEDGTWKEFGIGRSEAQYTWLPFWLFAIVWAILSYIIVSTVVGAGTAAVAAAAAVAAGTPMTVEVEPVEQLPKPKRAASTEMKPGYYVLDVEETAKKGMPKYVYLGPEAPNLVYNMGEKGEVRGAII